MQPVYRAKKLFESYEFLLEDEVLVNQLIKALAVDLQYLHSFCLKHADRLTLSNWGSILSLSSAKEPSKVDSLRQMATKHLLNQLDVLVNQKDFALIKLLREHLKAQKLTTSQAFKIAKLSEISPSLSCLVDYHIAGWSTPELNNLVVVFCQQKEANTAQGEAIIKKIINQTPDLYPQSLQLLLQIKSTSLKKFLLEKQAQNLSQPDLETLIKEVGYLHE